MKTRNKALLALVCAVALVAGSVFGTYAYLTDKSDTVTNTFTVGNVAITMTEAKVNEYGKLVDVSGKAEGETDYNSENLADRIDVSDTAYTQSFVMVPGHTYKKDPKVTVTGGSEKCYVFVKVVNPFTDIEKNEDGNDTIAEQIVGNGWTALDATNKPGVYYKLVEKSATDTPEQVFSTFTLSNNANTDTTNWKGGSITVTAYAIQADGMTDAAAAWTAGDWN